MLLSYTAARQKVIEIAEAQQHQPSREIVDLARACGRVLADSVVADRDYPPFDRSTRDGFAGAPAPADVDGAERFRPSCGASAKLGLEIISSALLVAENACRS